MKGTRKYRQYVAVLLWITYTFIAVPAQLWHHHSTSVFGDINKFREKGNSIKAAASALAGENCSVCAHKYSAYNDDAVVPVVAPFLVFFQIEDFCTVKISPFALLSHSNKGPPRLG